MHRQSNFVPRLQNILCIKKYGYKIVLSLQLSLENYLLVDIFCKKSFLRSLFAWKFEVFWIVSWEKKLPLHRKWRFALSFLPIWLHLLKKSLMENFIFLCSVFCWKRKHTGTIWFSAKNMSLCLRYWCALDFNREMKLITLLQKLSILLKINLF